MQHQRMARKVLWRKYSLFHADNAAGQNKNKTMLHYLSWRSFKGLNTEISLHFMTAGHTKCIYDACFGLIRLRYMRSITMFTTSCVLLLVLKPFVHHLRGMNGILFNRTFKCIRGISKYHNFRFTSVPGVIFVRVSPTAEGERISLIKPNVDLNNL